MSRPDWCPEDVWAGAVLRSGAAEPFYSPHKTRVTVARAILAERERCRGVANERAAQLFAGIQLPNSDETKAGWAGQMIEAILIERRITQGRVPKDSINIEGMHDLAKKHGFEHANT